MRPVEQWRPSGKIATTVVTVGLIYHLLMMYTLAAVVSVTLLAILVLVNGYLDRGNHK